MARVVVAGAGLGGLSAAYELRHLLPKDHSVTLVSDKEHFNFVPGWIPVVFGHKTLEDVRLPLAKIVPPQGIEFVHGAVTQLDPHGQRVTAGDRSLDYDYLVIATGPQLATDAVPGLGPEAGYTHSVCNPHHVLDTKAAWERLLADPGPVVVGAAPGAGCFGPAYEFILTMDQELRQRGLRDRVSLTLVTPEPYIGHMGVRDVKNADRIMQRVLRERGIETLDNACIQEIQPEAVVLADNQRLPFKFAMILPAFYGAEFLRQTPEVANDKGFVPMLPTQQHPDFPSIYSVGVASQVPQPDKTQVPIGMPKSGEMTEGMAMAAAHNIARELGALKEPPVAATMGALCFMEYGNDGMVFMANPVIPDPVTGKRNRSFTLRGRWVPLAKQAFETYYLNKMRFGTAVPWFETLGLKMLFGIALVKPLTAIAHHPSEEGPQTVSNLSS